MARTVTVPPVTGVLIRDLKVPDTLPANHSVVAFGETRIVFNVVQTIPPPDDAPGIMGVFCGQHSIVTCPAVTGPLPWILNVTNRASGNVRVKPFPVVAFTCNAVVTLAVILRCPLVREPPAAA
jgi:hypothetical protein